MQPLVIWGVSGAGKTTLINHLNEHPQFRNNFEFCVSYTTRKPRVGEVNGENYLFLSDAEFENISKQK